MFGIADARDLHKGLKVGRDYTNWIKDRIEKYGFIEGEDFQKALDLSTPNPASAKARAQTIHVYTLTLDMAKELAMVENNEQGRLIRRYFIWADNQLHARLSAGQSAQLPAPLDYGGQLTAIRDENRKLYGALKKQQVEQANRVLDRLERMATGLTALDRNVRYSCKADRDILNIVRDALVTEARQAITAVKVDVNVPPAPAPVPASYDPPTRGTRTPEMRVVSLKEVARTAGIGLSTLRRRIDMGTGPHVVRLSTRRVGVRIGDLRAWLDGL